MASIVGKFGLVRNGEHCGIYDTREQAEHAIVKARAEDYRLVRDGWISQYSADDTHYWVEKIKHNVW